MAAHLKTQSDTGLKRHIGKSLSFLQLIISWNIKVFTTHEVIASRLEENFLETSQTQSVVLQNEGENEKIWIGLVYLNLQDMS